MKKKTIVFIRDLIIMAVIILAVYLVFWKLNIIENFDISYIIGFLIGWSIWQVIVLFKKKD
jgi:hypothetical protein